MAVQFPTQPRRPSHPGSPNNSSANIDTTNKNHKHPIPPSIYERFERTSFSSIKESNSGGVQSFTDSKTSSYLRNESYWADEDAIDDSNSGSATPVQQIEGGNVRMLNPHSTLHGLVCPCDGFKGWKSISVGGKIASKSFGDLTKLRMRWDWDTDVKKVDEMVLDGVEEKTVLKVEDGRYPAGRSPFELLPMELLGKPFCLVTFILRFSKRVSQIAARFPTEWRSSATKPFIFHCNHVMLKYLLCLHSQNTS